MKRQGQDEQDWRRDGMKRQGQYEDGEGMAAGTGRIGLPAWREEDAPAARKRS